MSTNVEFDFTITGFTTTERAEQVVAAVAAIMEEENIYDQGVGVGHAVLDGEIFISGETRWPLGISRSRFWRPYFEGKVAAAAEHVEPAARTEFSWRYPDED
ncbi:hypothetical protein BJY24_000572 [Nocardia transvalensis]|uniref:Uncharacterized protein n=1 Tax=Nocardia transvalensis TaxID=37333 RepID=A0A7W9P965_9NOCA|nr:hypothetical protein [Nocardia transvalensis]MBB5911705.1 hypothetical protein [Nocardia transvalensis]